MITVELAVHLTAVVSGLFAAYSGLGYAFLRDSLDENGIFSWTIIQASYESGPSRLLKPVLSRYTFVLAARVVVGVLLAISAAYAELSQSSQGFALLFPLFVSVLLLSDVFTFLRFPGGLSGAAHMSLVLNGGLLFLVLFPNNDVVQTAALLFIAIQGVLSYFVAGFAKAAGPLWRNGKAVEVIFTTRSWGDDRIMDLIQTVPPLRKLGSWSVMGFELLFPLVLVVDPRYLPAMFAIAVAFHLFNAVFMGINGFLFSFPGTYPAIYYVNESGLIPRIVADLGNFV